MADSIAGVSRVVGGLMGALWVLAAVLLVVVFTVLGRGRTREFAVLRVAGASRSALARVVFTESTIVGAIGAVVGLWLAALLMLCFGGLLEDLLGLPFLMPDAGTMVGLAVAVFVVTVVACSATSAASALRLSKVDVGQTLREE